MHYPLAAVNEDSTPMQENLNNVLHALFGVFENLSEMGATWGEPWQWLFPLFVALGVALAFAAGFRSVFDLSADKIKGLFVIALVVVGLLALGGITDAGDEAVANEQSNGGGG